MSNFQLPPDRVAVALSNDLARRLGIPAQQAYPTVLESIKFLQSKGLICIVPQGAAAAWQQVALQPHPGSVAVPQNSPAPTAGAIPSQSLPSPQPAAAPTLQGDGLIQDFEKDTTGMMDF